MRTLGLGQPWVRTLVEHPRTQEAVHVDRQCSKGAFHCNFVYHGNFRVGGPIKPCVGKQKFL